MAPLEKTELTMKVAPLPFDENQRLASIRLLKILDTPAEERFDRITRIAQKLLGFPVALITVIDQDRQWFKSKQGTDVSETPRELAFCGYAILGDGPFTIPDMLLDDRFADNPLVTNDPNVRAYAGQPIHMPDGQKMGTLCVLDLVPRELTEEQLGILRDLGAMVEDELRLYEAVHLQGQLAETNVKLANEIIEREQIQAERDVLIRELQVAHRVANENSRLKSEFLSTMSHEVRTPLNAIEGFTSIMLSDMGVNLDPQARRMVERVSTNSKRLLHLINDFLDLSRIESGRLDVVRLPLSPADLAAKWTAQVGVLGEKKALAFHVHVDPTLPAKIYGDEELLSKIAINLLGNAFKFTSIGSVSLALKNQGATWTLEVTDTGIGIPPHAREYIFDEFRQVDGSSKRLYGGSGLGLAIVQKLVRAMNGTITVQSEVGQGTTFTVTLPLENELVAEGALK